MSSLDFRAAVITCRRWPKTERTSWRRLKASAKQAQEPDWNGGKDADEERDSELLQMNRRIYCYVNAKEIHCSVYHVHYVWTYLCTCITDTISLMVME